MYYENEHIHTYIVCADNVERGYCYTECDTLETACAEAVEWFLNGHIPGYPDHKINPYSVEIVY